MSNRFKLILFSFFTFCLFIMSPSFTPVHAKCVVTDVGAPKLSPNPPPECGSEGGDGGQIVDWAKKIAEKLELGYGGRYNKMMATISNNGYTAKKAPGNPGVDPTYWCANLVIDAHNLAGIKGLSIPAGDQLVSTMHTHMKSLSGYYAMDFHDGKPNKEVLTRVKPGDALIFGDGGHVEVVKAKSINEKGQGSIATYASNSSGKDAGLPGHKWQVNNWVLIKGSGFKTMIAFGGPK